MNLIIACCVRPSLDRLVTFDLDSLGKRWNQSNETEVSGRLPFEESIRREEC